MPITAQQEASLSTRMSAKYKQDTKVPLLINLKDGRLIANSINVRDLPDYRPYTGNPKASIEERMKFIASSIGGSRSRVVDSSAEAPEFDVAKATKDEIVTFAFNEFGVVLSEETDIRTLRKQLMAAAEAASSHTDLS
jgi:hypothetical protein